jgi:hypothetical protein
MKQRTKKSIDNAAIDEWNSVTDSIKKYGAVNAMLDPVNNPEHYNKGDIECIDGIEAMLTKEEFIGYLRGNSLKYRWRFPYKNGVEDLKKAEWYEKRLLNLLTEDEKE